MLINAVLEGKMFSERAVAEGWNGDLTGNDQYDLQVVQMPSLTDWVLAVDRVRSAGGGSGAPADQSKIPDLSFLALRGGTVCAIKFKVFDASTKRVLLGVTVLSTAASGRLH